MKISFRGAALLLTLFMALFLTACAGAGSGGAERAAEEIQPVQGVSTAVPTVAVADADGSEGAGLQLVGNTARPQFLNSYARW